MRPSDPVTIKILSDAHLEQLRGRPLPRRPRSTRAN